MVKALTVPDRHILLSQLKRLKKKAEAAKVFGVSLSTINQWCYIHDISQKDYGSVVGFQVSKRPTEDEIIKAVADVGPKPVAIAKRFGVVRETAALWLDHYKIDRRRIPRLEPDDIRLIRALEEDLTAHEVAEKFEVSYRTIKDVWNRVSWQHIR